MADSSKDAAPAEAPADVVAPRHVVKVEATVVHVNTAYERYLYRGAQVPASVTADEIQRLLDLGFIEAV